jgi:hypothetical protein
MSIAALGLSAVLTCPQGITESTSPPGSAFPVHMQVIGRHATGIWNKSTAEIAAWHAPSKRLLVVDATVGLRVLDLSDPLMPRQVQSHAAPGATSVAVHGDLVALVRQPASKAERGTLELLTADLRPIASCAVGHGPDMVCFVPDGTRLLIANEGEGEPDNAFDPHGSIGVVDISAGADRPVYRGLGFEAFEPQRAQLTERGLHCVMPGATLAQDLEPEYIAVAPDGSRAFATLQENNAIAVIDLAPGAERVARLEPLGFKDFANTGGLDASDKDGGPNIRPWPVLGLYQPDTVKCFEHEGSLWLATANEGEERERGNVQEPRRLSDLKHALGPEASAKDGAGRLQVSGLRGDGDGDGTFERVFCFGGRSVSLWKVQADGSLTQAWDSGAQIEQLMQQRMPEAFNADSEPGMNADSRSDNRGPEPEGLDVGVVGDRRLLFVGLERSGGVMAWDITVPERPVWVGWINPRDPKALTSEDRDGDGKPDGPFVAGDVAPEGVLFIPAGQSPAGVPLVAVCNEVSGTTTLIRVQPAADAAAKK